MQILAADFAFHTLLLTRERPELRVQPARSFHRPTPGAENPPLRGRAHSYRARCASKTGRSGRPLSSTLLFTNSHSRGDGLGSSANCAHRPSTFRLCAVCEHSACPSLAPPPRPSFQHSTSREGNLTALHCAHATSTFLSYALCEQAGRSGCPLSSLPSHRLIPPLLQTPIDKVNIALPRLWTTEQAAQQSDGRAAGGPDG